MQGLTIRRRDSVGIIGISRPEQGNALDDALPGAIGDAVEDLGADPEIRGIVLTGEGRFFCVGGDVSTLVEWRDLDLDARIGRYTTSQQVVHTMKACPVPVVAAVNGPAAGAGVDLALAADVCIAAHAASFTAAFAKVGLVPDLGGSWFLARRLGLAEAAKFLLRGERLSATDAREAGFVDQVVDDDSLLTAACAVIDDLTATCSRPAVTETLLALRGAPSHDLQTSMHLAAQAQARLMSTPEHEERVAAFLTSSR